MITRSPILDAALRVKEAANASFQDIITEMLAQLVVKYRLSSVKFRPYTNEYRRSGLKIDAPELDDLNDFFKEHVRPEGFDAFWSSGEGWTRYRGWV